MILETSILHFSMDKNLRIKHPLVKNIKTNTTFLLSIAFQRQLPIPLKCISRAKSNQQKLNEILEMEHMNNEQNQSTLLNNQEPLP
jgi:hypothetical protein